MNLIISLFVLTPKVNSPLGIIIIPGGLPEHETKNISDKRA
jgi:hypothetical protein